MGIVSTVCDHMLTFNASYELLSLSDIVLLSSGQHEPQGIAEAIDGHVDLCSEPTSASTEGLRCLPTVFLGAPAAE